jgi:hypothetical protein
MLALTGFTLAPHVHACTIGPHVIFLDLRANRYFGLSGDQSSSTTVSLDDEQLHELVQRGALVPAVGGGRDTRRQIERPTTAAIEGYSRTHVTLTAADLALVGLASASAAFQLKFLSLERIVRRMDRLVEASTNEKLDLELARTQIRKFVTLRPFFFRANNACLLNSLAMHEFLAWRGMRTHFVFGVCADPFKAHCWLQRDHIVINDVPEFVNDYTPILVL